VRWNDIDFEILPEIGHVLSNVHHSRATDKTLTPRTSVNCAEHHIVLCLDRGVESGVDDDGLQFASVDDERFAPQTEPARFIEKEQSPRVQIADMND
jgi:hypothetical protein